MSYIRDAFEQLTDEQKKRVQSISGLDDFTDDEKLFDAYDKLCDAEVDAIVSNNGDSDVISEIVTIIGNAIAENEGYE